MTDFKPSSAEVKLRGAFMTAFSLPENTDFEGLKYREIEQWSSIGHMRLVAEIEREFDIMLETDDILDLSSYPIAREIVGKYGADFSD